MKLVAALSASLVAVASGTGLQAWSKALDSSGSQDTPVTRVVNLLTEMAKTLEKDMDEDEALFKELACWCHSGRQEKEDAVKASTAKIAELGSLIEGSAAKSSELKATIQELEEGLASDKQALAEATELREKQSAEFHSKETDSVQAVENLKAAIFVLSKHQDAPENGGAVFKDEKDAWSLLQLKSFPWSDSREARDSRGLDNFMRHNGFDDDVSEDIVRKPIAPHKFLQQAAEQAAPAAPKSSWSFLDTVTLRRAITAASAFVQAKHETGYFPAYNAQSGEIFGVLKQLGEEMAGDLKDAQKFEQERSAAFQELKSAKTEEIKVAETMSEQKETELANMDNDLAEAKEDIEKETNVLAAEEEFLANLVKMCDKGSADFDERKAARLEEMKAVGETIEILQGDEARDAMTGTYSFLQLAAGKRRRTRAAELLRKAARRTHSPEMALLATSVELDAFTKVKAAIDDMVVMLKKQQEDEVKKNDWCKAEVHDNEMTTAKTEDKKADIEANIGELTSTIKTLEQEISDAHMAIEQAQMDLQRATEDRKAENFEFQKTVSDQTVTIEVLKKALDKLATYYDFLQQSKSSAHKQTPPVPQKEYSKSKGASGVMEMIEKLIHEAADLRKESQQSEGSAQAAYETLIADTNGSVEALQKEITSKSAAKSGAHKDMLSAESDLSDTMKELEGLNKYNSELHAECNYLLKNFDLRQSTRSNEIEALQQAKQILDGASLN
mmetsp:Transcript_95735/g.253016  ORF Transcript_95735/g.253016 Transcript_95735/m.253016 type:complete len:730 (+) Transcript_95735:59-2248(+)